MEPLGRASFFPEEPANGANGAHGEKNDANGVNGAKTGTARNAAADSWPAAKDDGGPRAADLEAGNVAVDLAGDREDGGFVAAPVPAGRLVDRFLSSAEAEGCRLRPQRRRTSLPPLIGG